jgi:predicted acylesterase/phospholipase RssA
MTGVLADYEDARSADVRRCRRFIGTSAGSIVAASLVAGRAPRRPRSGKARAIHPLQNPDTALRALPEGRRSIAAFGDEVDRWGATFDGRLRVCTVDAGNGRRVVFGSRLAPPASVGQAVAASCAIPAVFAPVRIGDRLYVDGGAWSPTNADAAPAGRGDRVLLLEPTAVLRLGRAARSRSAGGRRAPEPWRRGADRDPGRLGPPLDGPTHGPRSRRARPSGGLSARTRARPLKGVPSPSVRARQSRRQLRGSDERRALR